MVRDERSCRHKVAIIRLLSLVSRLDLTLKAPKRLGNFFIRGSQKQEPAGKMEEVANSDFHLQRIGYPRDSVSGDG